MISPDAPLWKHRTASRFVDSMTSWGTVYPRKSLDWACGDFGTIFVDVSSGPYYTTLPVPDDGTHFNFITRGGVGITVPLSDECEVIGGAHYMHLSNARVHGSDQNPGLDAVEGYIGLIWKL